jgi:ribosomal-protein-alanine N-acetyltransferase
MIILRPFRENDLQQVIALVKETFNEDYKPETYLAFANAWHDGFMIAEENGKVIGMLVATIPAYKEARILIMAVKKGYRSRGLGSNMMNHFVSLCRSLGFTSIRLEVRESNMGAISFYNRHGFRIVGYIPCYYRDGEAGHIMQLILVS